MQSSIEDDVDIELAREEFFEKVFEIQQNELCSKRYKDISKFVEENYYNRNSSLERELFKSVGGYLDDDNKEQSYEYRQLLRLERYENFCNFMNSLSSEEINSNVFLRFAKAFDLVSNDYCLEVMKNLYTNIQEGKEESSEYSCILDIPNSLKEILPRKIQTEIGIKSNMPDGDVRFVEILDPSHDDIYYFYNQCADRIHKILSDIFVLKINMLLYVEPVDERQLECNSFDICYEYDVDDKKKKDEVEINISGIDDKEKIASNIEQFVNNFIKKLDNDDFDKNRGAIVKNYFTPRDNSINTKLHSYKILLLRKGLTDVKKASM